MPNYARIDSGLVAEIFTPPPGLSITDCFHGSLVWVPCDGTPGISPGWSANQSGGTWFFAPPPPPPSLTLAQQAAVAVDNGITLTCVSDASLDGKYNVDAIAQGRIAATSTYILVNGTFPGGASTRAWLDMSGQPHVFSSTVTFQAFGTKIADYIAALDVIIVTNSGSLPSPNITIP